MLQVVDIKRQANEALQQAQAEITEAEQAAANAHQQVLGEPMLFPLSMHHAFTAVTESPDCNTCNAMRVSVVTQHMQSNVQMTRNAMLTYFTGTNKPA